MGIYLRTRAPHLLGGVPCGGGFELSSPAASRDKSSSFFSDSKTSLSIALDTGFLKGSMGGHGWGSARIFFQAHSLFFCWRRFYPYPPPGEGVKKGPAFHCGIPVIRLGTQPAL